MQRLFDKLQFEGELFGAVMERRPRSILLLLMAIAGSVLMKLAFLFLMTRSPETGLADAFRPLGDILALVVAFKIGLLAVRTYLRDRAQLLRF